MTLVLNPGRIDESGSGNRATLSARVTPAVAGATTTVTVRAAPADAVRLSGTRLVIAPGATRSGTITVTAVDDEVEEPDETVTLSGTVAEAGRSGPAPVHLVVTDDDGATRVSAMVHHLPLFVPAADALGRQSFARIVNDSGRAGEVRIDAFDDAGRAVRPADARTSARTRSRTSTPTTWRAATRPGGSTAPPAQALAAGVLSSAATWSSRCWLTCARATGAW